MENNSGILQNLILENREKLSISGVSDVLSFDDQIIIIETDLGLLTIKGENVRINKLSIDTSEVIVEGDISYLAYSNKEVEKGKSSTNSSKGVGGKVNINSANQTELETLPGIGPSLAQRIIEYREVNGEFEKIEDLQNVKGIGDSKYSNIKEKICI